MLRQTPNGRRCELKREREDAVPDGAVSGGVAAIFSNREAVRPEIADSWERSLRSVDPSRGCAPTHTECATDLWNASPLRRPIDELADDLQQIAHAGFVVGVTDEWGTLLWTCGGRVMRRRAERVNFAPGARWSESAVGTNALALALHNRRPSAVFSSEHLVDTLHDWVCYSSPIRSPHGKTLGALDFSTTCKLANPLAMATVRAMAALVETRVRELQPTSVARDSAAKVALRCLSRTEVTVDDAPVQVSPRQAEILALLTLRPDGYTPAELSLALYGDRPVSMSTLKSEVSRLRRMMGGGIAAHRYMLTAPVWCDAVEVLRCLSAGDTVAAVEQYRGPLLPHSEAPGVVDWRHRLEVAIREAALQSNDPNVAIILGERIDHDFELHEHALNLLPPTDSRTPLVAGRLSVSRRNMV
ncbi:transcriptional regulator (plasmid) [Mycobacterium dioxanotrophicus]|uniref:Transcriptional regulator n=1 Tax=Mycobacterium dioxanotrophicus TaxID=482462 RepID=A0A1Y0CGR6_9MYCO|nr:GAF domain-containing protein [Mycobacterium dioxanotrophicus]ART74451.1 transcriptional regulator [Mycobacterium dioxanotrophicus]UJL30645.1 transcriptional regulator [Mycolicibacterium vanbaalenii]